MPTRPVPGWADITAKHLSGLGGDDFEQFCYDLVGFEARDRHVDPELDGPAKKYTGDGGRDVMLTTTAPPSVTKLEYQQRHSVSPVTEDRIGRTAYSCKTGPSWLDLVLKDINERVGEPRCVDVLREGGYFKVLVDAVGQIDRPVARNRGAKEIPHAHIVDALLGRLAQPGLLREDLARRVKIYDAHHLVDFLKGRRPEMGALADWRERLELAPVLLGRDAWEDWHSEERTNPKFVPDGERSRMIGELRQFLRASTADVHTRIAWLVGPPGVGKTRLVLEALLDPVLGPRVCAARNMQEFLDALDAKRLLERHPNALVIVDDCSPDQARDAAQRFAVSRSGADAHLLILTPASAKELPSLSISRRWELKALDETAMDQLIRGILDGSSVPDGTAHRVAELSRGYPWFATLLAHEAREEHRAPITLHEAMLWALASAHEAAGHELEGLRLRRARCLLAASLTPDMNWLEMDDATQDALMRAVGLRDWSELLSESQHCLKRGILRRDFGWQYKYVTPLILEREVIDWLLGDNGPDPGGRRLTRHAGPHLGAFSARMSRLGVSVAVTRRIADAALEDLEGASEDWSALRQAGFFGPRLEFVARHHPRPTALRLRRLIEGTPPDELRERTDGRRTLVETLGELVHRRGAFVDAEAALFHLAVAENEGYSSNASGEWANLFFGLEVYALYEPLERLMSTLEQRLAAGAVEARLVALTGLERLFAWDGYRLHREPEDGEWLAPDARAIDAARERAWHLLAALCHDPAPTLSARARRVVEASLGSAARVDQVATAAAAVSAVITAWGDERAQLVEAIEELQTYHGDSLSARDHEAVAALAARLAPRSFHERLHLHVGRWGTALETSGADRLEQEDRLLAREGLAGDRPILDELEWLASAAAVRGGVFAETLGRCDEEGALVEPLVLHATRAMDDRRGLSLLPRYVRGAHRAGHEHVVTTALDRIRSEPEAASLLALAVFAAGPTDERIAWLEGAARTGTLDGASVRALERWPDNLDAIGAATTATWLRWVDILLAGPPDYVAAALTTVWQRIQHQQRPDPSLVDRLHRALEATVAAQPGRLDARLWQRGARFLLERGGVEAVARLAVAGLARRGSSELRQATLNVYGAVQERDPELVWRAVADVLGPLDDRTYELMAAFQFSRVRPAWPSQLVLAWVGADERRGSTIAAMLRPHAAELDPIARGLLRRFGAHGRIADQLAAQVHGTGRIVASLAEHDKQQLEHVRRWLDDPDLNVRVFAERLLASLQVSLERHAAHEEYERRRWGT
jgi:hypothetical protein